MRQLARSVTLVVLLLSPATGAASGACKRDQDCGPGRLCVGGQCKTHRRHVNLLYLFYLSSDRTFSEVLGIFWQRTGARGYRVLFPLYWSFWSGDEGSGSSAAPRTQARVLFPFYFDLRDEESKERQIVVPPVQVHTTPAGREVRVWPLLFHQRTEDGEKSRLTLVPFFHHGRSGKRMMTILPLFLSFHQRDPEHQESRGLAGGIVYWARSPGRWSAAVLPLFYHRQTGDRGTSWVFPFNLVLRSPGSFTWLSFPWLFAHSSGDSAALLSLAPPLFYSRRGTYKKSFYLPPLALYHRHSERRFLALGPVYYRSNETERYFGIAPLLFTGRSPSDRHVVVFPIVWYLSHSERVAQTEAPRERRTLVAGPFYHHSSPETRAWGLAPLLHGGRSGSDSHLVLFPVLWDLRTRQQHTLAVLPLFATQRLRGGKSWFVSPFFLFGRDPARGRHNWAIIAPIFIHYRDPELALDALPPLFARWTDRTTGTRTTVIPPLVMRANRTRSARVFFPLVWRFSDREEQRSTTVVLPFYHRRHREGWRAGLLPLLHVGRSSTGHHAVLFPLLWHSRRADRSTTIAGPLLLRRRTDAAHLALLPLFYAGRSGAARHLALLPLFWADWRPGAGRVFTPIFGLDDDGESRTIYAGPYLARRTPGGESHALLPLVYSSRRRSGGGSLWLFPGYYGSWSDQRSFHMLFPLFVRARSGEREATALAPLLWDFRSATGRTTLFFPVLLRVEDRLRSSVSTVVAPNLWLRMHPGGVDAIAFPIVWRFQRDDRRSTVVFPLYWDLRRGERRTTVLFPLFWRFERPDHRTTVVLNSYLRRGKVPGSYDLNIVPFVRVQRQRPEDLRLDLLGGFFGYERAGRERTLRLLFVPIGLPQRCGAPACAARIRRSSSAMAASTD